MFWKKINRGNGILFIVFQILDASYNRIRDLSPASFGRYTDLQYLYLADNMIQTIEPGTFSILQHLEAVDLSYNALTTIPVELFSLPLLRNLYIYSNNLNDLPTDLQVRPIAKTLLSIWCIRHTLDLSRETA